MKAFREFVTDVAWMRSDPPVWWYEETESFRRTSSTQVELVSLLKKAQERAFSTSAAMWVLPEEAPSAKMPPRGSQPAGTLTLELPRKPFLTSKPRDRFLLSLDHAPNEQGMLQDSLLIVQNLVFHSSFTYHKIVFCNNFSNHSKKKKKKKRKEKKPFLVFRLHKNRWQARFDPRPTNFMIPDGYKLIFKNENT